MVSDAERREILANVVERFFRAVEDQDADAWVSLYAPNAICFDPVDATPTAGERELRERFEQRYGSLGPVTVAALDRFWSQDGAAVKWIAQTKRDGEVVADGIDVFEIDDAGQIRTVWGYSEKDA